MKVKQIIDRSRRDFTAILECEFCGHEQNLYDGYDDANYHNNVIPAIKCGKCGQNNHESYKPLKPLYPEGMQI